MLDTADVRLWANYVDTFDAEGDRITRVTTFDDGAEVVQSLSTNLHVFEHRPGRRSPRTLGEEIEVLWRLNSLQVKFAMLRCLAKERTEETQRNVMKVKPDALNQTFQMGSITVVAPSRNQRQKISVQPVQTTIDHTVQLLDLFTSSGS